MGFQFSLSHIDPYLNLKIKVYSYKIELCILSSTLHAHFRILRPPNHHSKMPAARETSVGLVTTSAQPAVASTQLPSASDPDLVLETANLPEYEQTWRLNAAEWKGILTNPAYLDRELFLINADLTRGGNATAWLLTSPKFSKNEDDSRPILSACESLLKNAYIAKGGKLDRVLAHGIGSVFCRPEHRGKGYAQRMMKELGTKLETWQQPKNSRGHFSVLYSDIGPKFYAKQGWKVYPSTHIWLQQIDEAEYAEKSKSLPQVQDLTTADVTALPIIPNLETSLINLSTNAPEKTFVAFKPDMAHFQWHFMREEFLSEFLGHKFPSVKGAMDRETGIALVWTRTFSSDAADWHLSVLYVHIPVQLDAAQIIPSMSALLLRAQYEATLSSLQAGIELWDPRDEIVKAAQSIAEGVKVISRDQEHICSLKWNGSDTDEVLWLANERFAWC